METSPRNERSHPQRDVASVEGSFSHKKANACDEDEIDPTVLANHRDVMGRQGREKRRRDPISCADC